MFVSCFFFQAEDGIRDLVRSRGLGDVYKRQHPSRDIETINTELILADLQTIDTRISRLQKEAKACLLYTSDAADERSSVDLGGRRIIKKKKHTRNKRIEIINTKHKRLTR